VAKSIWANGLATHPIAAILAINAAIGPDTVATTFRAGASSGKICGGIGMANLAVDPVHRVAMRMAQ